MSNSLPVKEIFSSIQGEGLYAGRRQIFIRLTGCNLHCRYCDTEHQADSSHQIEESPGSGIFVTDSRTLSFDQLDELIAAWCRQLPAAHHSISITGGEPLLHADLLVRLLPRLRAHLPVHLETNGTLPLALAQVIDYLDYISMDMKLPSAAACSESLWEIHGEFLKLASSRQVAVKTVIRQETTVDEIRMAAEIIRSIAPATPLFLQPCTERNRMPSVSATHILELQAAAAQLLSDVRVIPQMHLMLGAL